MDRARRVGMVVLALGLYLTLRGYHSRDGDQAYRLPLLLHRQDPGLFSDDPFVLAIDDFNPHVGSLALLDAASRPFGLSVALFGLFALTFGLTCLAADRLGRSCWPDRGPVVGVMAVALLMTAKAGNVGTNHLFEAMLLDRLMALSLGWLAILSLVIDPRRGAWMAAVAIGFAAVVHPSLGLQIATLAGSGLVAWSIFGQTSLQAAVASAGLMALAVVPGLALVAGGKALMDGLAPGDFYTLAALVQGPQHMIPHLWRSPQWIAWACFPILAIMSMLDSEGSECSARWRVLILLVVNLAILAASWVAIELIGSVRATIFQPFRLATVARGLCLILISGRIRDLWVRGSWSDMARLGLIFAGLTGDWSFVVATAVEVASCSRVRPTRAIPGIVLAIGLVFLARHDTESGDVRLIAAIAASSMLWAARRAMPSLCWNRRRAFLVAGLAWVVPASAIVLPMVATGRSVEALKAHCRFGEWPGDDIERLATWCREHTPEDARFIGPPGPKTFRLWSRRSVAFNRSASPYHARGLADWADRFRDHVGFRGTVQAFAQKYLRDHQALERGYQDRTDAERADLALRHGASYVIAAAPKVAPSDDSGLRLLRVEGRYALFGVVDRPGSLTTR